MAMMRVVLRIGALGLCADCPRDGSRRLLCSWLVSAKPFRGRSSDSLQERKHLSFMRAKHVTVLTSPASHGCRSMQTTDSMASCQASSAHLARPCLHT